MELVRPKGLTEIIQTFGNVPLLAADGIITPEEEATFLTVMDLPFPMKLSWANTMVSRMKCNKKMVNIFHSTLEEIKKAHLEHLIKEYGGCYAFRPKRTSGSLSTHSWGIAIDLNPTDNPLGSKGNMPGEIVTIFKDKGFIWGGDFKDPMHFQFCERY